MSLHPVAELIALTSPASIAGAVGWLALRLDGLFFLIDQAAADVFDDVSGYVELIIEKELYSLPAFSTIPADCDGLRLCYWIDGEFPIDAPHGGKLIVLH